RRTCDRGNHHDGQRYSPSQGREMFLIKNHNGVGHNSDHDRRHTIQYISSKANPIAETVASKLRQVDASPNAQRNPYDAGQTQDEDRSDNRIRHSAASLAHRLWSLGEKGPIDRSHTAEDRYA